MGTTSWPTATAIPSAYGSKNGLLVYCVDISPGSGAERLARMSAAANDREVS